MSPELYATIENLISTAPEACPERSKTHFACGMRRSACDRSRVQHSRQSTTVPEPKSPATVKKRLQVFSEFSQCKSGSRLT
jgi:hypothetical protein